MSLFGLHTGLPQTESAIITGTDPVDVLTANGPNMESGTDVTDILVVNSDGSGVAAVVSRYDGADEFPLIDQTVPTKEFVHLKMPIRLLQNETIRVTANAGITVHVSHMQPSSMSRMGG